MAIKLKLEIAGVIENMSGFVTPTGERYQLFGEGGGQLLAEELEVPLLGKVPLTMGLREQSDAGLPIVASDPDDPAAQALGHAARGLIALSPIELPVMQAPAPAAAPQAGRHVAADGLNACGRGVARWGAPRARAQSERNCPRVQAGRRAVRPCASRSSPRSA